jgi:hypothetical protein
MYDVNFSDTLYSHLHVTLIYIYTSHKNHNCVTPTFNYDLYDIMLFTCIAFTFTCDFYLQLQKS